jgi:aryl-alcohol dehydrogenase-like predicted oxidoreductase
MTVKQRKFGHDGVLVSEVGLGTWQIGGSWGQVSEEDALSILHAALENGVTFFDTADVYGNGRSETLIGRFLKQTGAEVFVATKLGRNSKPGWPDNFTLDAMRAHTEASLRRLGHEALDLTQLHCVPTEVLRQGEVFDSLRLLQQEGKILRFGASVESMEEALLCLQQEGLASLQIIFNIFRQKPIDALFEAAQEKGVALIVRLPLASGLLSGKFTQSTQFDESDHRNFNRDGDAFNVGETFAGLPFEKGVALTDDLKAMLPEGMTMAQMALRWILDFEAVTTIIPGASKLSQVASNVSASTLPPLGHEFHAKLRQWYQAQVEEHIRGPY